MKRKRKIVAKSSGRPSKKVLAKRRIKRARPVHKRVLLHPVSVLILLCAGVFIVGWTIRAFADSGSVTVSATVEAPAPTSPATITSPDDQTHYTSTPITVSGVCVPNSYVNLYRNGNFSGAASCGAGVTSYQISTDLSLGANDLYTKIFSITDNEGPQSAQITVFYDQPSPPPPAPPSAPPGALQVTSQDNLLYHSGTTAVTSPYPTFRGIAPPNSKVIITIHSKVVTCITYADAAGFWSCSLDQPLTDDLHTVDIKAITPSGQVLYFPIYHIRVSPGHKPLLTIGSSSQPFLINANYKYQVYGYGENTSLNLSLTGGKSPYAVTVSWGDGSQSTILRKDSSPFAASHAYRPLSRDLKSYAIKVQAVDDNGAHAFLQTVAVVRGSQFAALSGKCAAVTPAAPYSAQAANTLCGNTASSLLSKARQWVWIIWPTYAVVLLMVFSFWLGERQEFQAILHKRPRR